MNDADINKNNKKNKKREGGERAIILHGLSRYRGDLKLPDAR